jgi:hypothetical protein
VLKSCLDDKPANRTGFAELFELLTDNPGEICRLDESKSAFESFSVATPDVSALNSRAQPSGQRSEAYDSYASEQTGTSRTNE